MWGLRSKMSLSQEVSFPINWVTSRNSGTGDNQIVLFDAQWTQDRRLISYWDSDIPGDKRKLNTATDSSKVEFSSVKFKSDQGGDNLTADSVYLHLFDFLYMFNVHVSLTFKQGNWTIEVEIFWYSDRAIYGHIAIATQRCLCLITLRRRNTRHQDDYSLWPTYATWVYLWQKCPFPDSDITGQMSPYQHHHRSHLCDLGSSLAVVTLSPSLNHSTLGSGLPFTWTG